MMTSLENEHCHNFTTFFSFSVKFSDLIQTITFFGSNVLKAHYRVELCSTLYSKLLFLLRIKHIIKILPVINAGTLETQKSIDYRVEEGLAKLKSINCPCPMCGPMHDR